MRAHDDPAIAARPFAADLPPLRCADASLCDLAPDCTRSVPPAPGESARYALFHSLREARGYCGHYIEGRKG